MARPCSSDLRERVVRAMRAGESCRSVAARFSVAASSAVKWAQRAARTGSVLPGEVTRRAPQAGARAASRLASGPGPRPPQDSAEGTQALLAEHSVAVSHDTIWGFLRACGSGFKKRRSWPMSARPDVSQRRERWNAAGPDDPRRLVFIDETWIKTDMAPLRGWAPRGTGRPAGRRSGLEHLHLVAALRHDRIDTPWVFDGPVTATSSGPMSRRCWARPSHPAMSS